MKKFKYLAQVYMSMFLTVMSGSYSMAQSHNSVKQSGASGSNVDEISKIVGSYEAIDIAGNKSGFKIDSEGNLYGAEYDGLVIIGTDLYGKLKPVIKDGKLIHFELEPTAERVNPGEFFTLKQNADGSLKIDIGAEDSSGKVLESFSFIAKKTK